MKSLEIQTNKKILIVETESFWIQVSQIGPDSVKFICLGSDLTEEIAERFAELIPGCKMTYHLSNGHDGNITSSATESFISAIEAAGYFWIDSPLRKPDYSIEWYDRSPSELERYEDDMEKYMDAESRTFHPEKVLIFEIVEGQF